MPVIKDGKEAGEATQCFIPYPSLGKAHEMVRVLAAIEKGVKAGCDSDLQTGGKWNRRSFIWI